VTASGSQDGHERGDDDPWGDATAPSLADCGDLRDLTRRVLSAGSLAALPVTPEERRTLEAVDEIVRRRLPEPPQGRPQALTLTLEEMFARIMALRAEEPRMLKRDGAWRLGLTPESPRFRSAWALSNEALGLPTRRRAAKKAA
jgi:hypothetical protein